MSSLFFFLLVLSILQLGHAQINHAKRIQVVAGYLPDYRGYINVNNTAPYLTDLILFSMEPQPDGSLDGCCLNEEHFQKAKGAKILNPKLNLWLSIGGGGRNAAFNSIASSPGKRRTLYEAAANKCKKNGLDGVDLDLYFPTTLEEHNKFVDFLLEASRYWRDQKLMISVALHPRNRLPPAAYESIDRIHLMTYDMVTSNGGHHASLGNIRPAVQTLVRSGCPSSKIAVGIPFYARHLRNPGLVKTFAELYDVDESMSSKAIEEFGFDTPDLIVEKTRYVADEGLLGVFAWELGQDKQTETYPGGILVSAMAGESVSFGGKAAPNAGQSEL